MTSNYCLNQLVQKQNFSALEAITNLLTGTPRFKDRKTLIHNVIAKITTTFIIVLMLHINLSSSLKLIKRIKAMVNGVKILAVTYFSL